MRTRPILSLFLLGASACITERGPFTNRMAHWATSSLARAARQPVNWQPWGRDAFARPAKLDRPVLLYVGGEACRWCAETARAIYTDPEIGALINALFVPVRVDRDERPDVAQRYQASVATMAGLRGWPLTVFLTPDGAAFFGGTYFAADDPVTGRGLKQILPEVAKSYRDRRAFIVQHAALVRQLALAGAGVGRGGLQADRLRPQVVGARAAPDAAVRSRVAGGSVMHAATVGEAPADRRAGGALDALLQRMYARGWGVRHAVAGPAQVGGGGLLQDQVQVAGACVAAYQVGGDAHYLAIARDLAALLETSYADPLGGYFDAALADPTAPALADRTKQVFDDILPRAHALTARVLLRLAAANGDASY